MSDKSYFQPLHSAHILCTLTNKDFAQGVCEKTLLGPFPSFHVEVAHQFIGHQPSKRKLLPIKYQSQKERFTQEYNSILGSVCPPLHHSGDIVPQRVPTDPTQELFLKKKKFNYPKMYYLICI